MGPNFQTRWVQLWGIERSSRKRQIGTSQLSHTYRHQTRRHEPAKEKLQHSTIHPKLPIDMAYIRTAGDMVTLSLQHSAVQHCIGQSTWQNSNSQWTVAEQYHKWYGKSHRKDALALSIMDACTCVISGGCCVVRPAKNACSHQQWVQSNGVLYHQWVGGRCRWSRLLSTSTLTARMQMHCWHYAHKPKGAYKEINQT